MHAYDIINMHFIGKLKKRLFAKLIPNDVSIDCENE